MSHNGNEIQQTALKQK